MQQVNILVMADYGNCLWDESDAGPLGLDEEDCSSELLEKLHAWEAKYVYNPDNPTDPTWGPQDAVAYDQEGRAIALELQKHNPHWHVAFQGIHTYDSENGDRKNIECMRQWIARGSSERGPRCKCILRA